MWIRALNTLLGIWLFFSAFVISRDMWQFTNTWIVGMLVTLNGLAWIVGMKWSRYLSVGLAGWLFISTVLIAAAKGNWVHNVVLSALLIITALFPERAHSDAPSTP
jgi:hypothetical protein